MLLRAALLLAAPVVMAAAAESGSVEVTVNGVHSNRGEVLVAICARATFLQENCAYRGRIAAQAGAVVVTVRGVPPGLYAAQAFQDENGNGKIDRSFFGTPTEGIGFSRDARMRFGPPSFDDAAFNMDRTAAVTVTLRYYD